MRNLTYVDPNELLETKVPEYVPNAYYATWPVTGYKRPVLTMYTIREMTMDPRVLFGLWLIKGPMLAKAKMTVESENEEVHNFVVDHLNNFWNNGAVQALKAVEWGYSGSEVLYEVDENTGQIIYKGLKDFESPSVRIVTNNGTRTGLLIDNFTTIRMEAGKAVYLGGPKAFHHVHWRHLHPYYGRTRLVAAHIPWYETWSEGGYRDIRRMWFYKNCFEGGIMYHPDGYANTPEGRKISFQDLAQEMLDKKRAGATLVMPSKFNAQNQRLWDYDPPKGNTIPAGLFDYGDSLRIEILEAMGIPYEVIENSGSEGFGSSSGREIPETAFYSILQEELTWLVHDYIEQVVRPMVQINAALGKMPFDTFNVLVHPLTATPEEFELGEEEMLQQQQPPNENVGEEGETGEGGETPQEPQIDVQAIEEKRKSKLKVAA